MFELRGMPHAALSVEHVPIAAADALALEIAGSTRSLTMRWAALSVIPTVLATSRSRTSGSLWMASSTCVWLVRKCQERASIS